MLGKLVSGGQSGVDRAALDVAMQLNIAHGGWCPKGRRAEDDPLAERYALRETPTADYRQRTEWNVRDADATLILTRGRPRGGTAATIGFAAAHGKPCMIVDLLTAPAPETVRDWIDSHRIRTLNVAGPRASGCPGIHEQAAAFLLECLKT